MALPKIKTIIPLDLTFLTGQKQAHRFVKLNQAMSIFNNQFSKPWSQMW